MAVLTLPPCVPGEELLTAAVETLLAAPSMELGPAQALDRLGSVLTDSERLAAVVLDGVRDLDARELFALDGAGSATGWLRARKVGGDPRLVALARRLVDCPVVRAALAEGVLEVSAAQKVCAALAEVPAEVAEDRLVAVLVDGTRDVLDELCGGRTQPADRQALAGLVSAAVTATALPAEGRLEPVFTFLAARVPPAALGRFLRDLVEALAPLLLEEPAEDEHQGGYVELQQVLDGRWHLTGDLDPETGSVLHAELERRMARPDQDDDRGLRDGGLHGDPADGGLAAGGSFRSAGQVRAAALGALARDGRGAEGSGAVRPDADITIVAREDTLTGGAGLPCRLSNGTRVPVETVRRLGCNGRIRAVVLDAHGHPVGVSGTHRNATARERRALEAQWGGCAVDGCSAPFSRTRPHHVIPWWLSHRTRLADLAPVCEHHHHDIHEGGRTLRLRDGRYINPTGWTDGPSG